MDAKSWRGCCAAWKDSGRNDPTANSIHPDLPLSLYISNPYLLFFQCCSNEDFHFERVYRVNRFKLLRVRDSSCHTAGTSQPGSSVYHLITGKKINVFLCNQALHWTDNQKAQTVFGAGGGWPARKQSLFADDGVPVLVIDRC